MIMRCLENVLLMLVLSNEILYIVFVCLFKLFVFIFNFLLPLVVNKDVQKAFTVEKTSQA